MPTGFFRRLLALDRSSPAVRRKQLAKVQKRKLLLEPLEDRSLMAAFVAGSIQGQDGWGGGGNIAISPSVDQEIDQGGMNAYTGVGAFRISNNTSTGNHNGAFDGWVFGSPLAIAAGQPDSGAPADRFVASFYFRAASAVADGTNVEIDLGTLGGDDRNTFLAITNDLDANGGLKIRMAEPDGSTGDFFATQIVATSLSRTEWHRIDITATFIDGIANDTFQASLDGVPLLNLNPASPNNNTANFGTFEGYRNGISSPYALSNRLYFRSGGAPSSFDASFSNTASQGLFIDNVSYSVSSSTNVAIAAAYSAAFEPQPATTYVDDNWANTPDLTLIADADLQTAGNQPAILGVDAFASIQAAVNAVTASGTVVVNAGVYSESVLVDKAVSIRGAQYGVDPRATDTAARAGGESIVQPLASDGANGNLFTVRADNVTVDGFTLQGSNDALGASMLTSNGIALHAARAVANGTNGGIWTPVNGLTVSNNIVQAFGRFGIGLYNPNAATDVSGNNLFTQNVIDNIQGFTPSAGSVSFGIREGVFLRNNAYADVTNNKLTRVSTGIQVQQNLIAAPGGNGPDITGNDITSETVGIYTSLQYLNANGANISDNQLRTVAGAMANTGIRIFTVQDAVTPVTSDNVIHSGAAIGYAVVQTAITGGLTISGGSVTGAQVGVMITNDLNAAGLGTSAPFAFDPTRVNLSNLVLTDNTTGIRVYDNVDNPNPNSAVSLDLNGVEVDGGATGLAIEGVDTNLIDNALGDIQFSGQSGDYITLVDEALAGLEIDGTMVKFNGLTGALLSSAANLAVENKITHFIDDPSLGFIRVKAPVGAVESGFATVDENSPNGTEVATIFADGSSTFTVTGGSGTAAFEVDSATGKITVKDHALLNFEVASEFTLEVSVDSTISGNDFNILFTIGLNDVNEGPVISAQEFFAFENSPNGMVVGQVVASDPDAGQSPVYSLVGGSGAFAISSSGQLTVADSTQLNFETAPAFSLTVQVADATNPALVSTATITVTLINLNEAPLIADQAFSTSENSAAGTIVGQVNATDPDAGQTVTYSITGGNGLGAFAISSSGQITVANAAALDFETNPSFALTVTASDNGAISLSSSATITVSLTGLNEAPVVGDQAFTIHARAVNGATVGQVAASDADAGQTLTYALSGSGAFAINPTTGEIRIVNARQLPRIPFRQSSVSVVLQVTVTDNAAPGLSTTSDVTITLTNNAAMQPIVANKTFSLAENNRSGAAVGIFTAKAAYLGQRFKYSLSGADSAKFRITAQGRITVAPGVKLDFEAQSSYDLQVVAADSKSAAAAATALVTVNVKNVNEPGQVTLLDAAGQPVASLVFAENLPQGTVVGKLSIIDPDTGAAGNTAIKLTDTLGALKYNSSTGEIFVGNSGKLDFEKLRGRPLNISVIATEQGTPRITQRLSFKAQVTNANDQPTNLAFTAARIPFGLTPVAAGVTFGKFKATDPDPAQTFTYQLVSGAGDADNAKFEIGGSSLDSLLSTESLNRRSNFSIRVRVTDQGGLSFEKVFKVRT